MTAHLPRRHEADAGLVPYDDGVELRKDLHALIDRFTTSAGERRQTHDGCAAFLLALMACPGRTLQTRWNHFEQTIWPRWFADDDRPEAGQWMGGPRAKHPSPLGIQTIRARLGAVSVAAGARRADGRPLVLLPHDCRRVFASEHLNNNVPVHVIQALLGHATLDTIMVYAKLYPPR